MKLLQECREWKDCEGEGMKSIEISTLTSLILLAPDA